MSLRSIGLISLLWISLPLPAMELQIETVDTQPGEFRFRYVYDDVVQEAPDRRARDILKGTTPQYIVWLDPDAVQKEKFDVRFNYEFYVQRKTGGPITRIDVEGTPKGAFNDHSVLAVFHLIEGAQSEEGKITLPVFGEDVSDSLTGEARPEEAYLADEKKVSLLLKNVSKSWLDIREVTVSGNREIWKSVSVERVGDPIRLGMNQTTGDRLKVILKPNTVQAFVKAFTPRAVDAVDDTITAYVTYDTRARPGQQREITVPIHFVPWMPELFLLVIVGALFGSFVPKSARGRTWRDRARAFGAAASVAVIAELVAMALKVTKTEARLFGLDLDPFQLPSAALIGLFVGMSGYRSLAAFRRLVESDFWKRGKERTSSA